MFSAKEIRQITFEKGVRGYRAEDVDSFMEKIADEFESLAKEKEKLEEQLYVLADRVEQYKGEEETIKVTLINAQKLGENLILEAKQKADALLKDATIRKNDILSSAYEEIQDHEANLKRVKREVSDFKISVLSMYKDHIESLSKLPEEKHEEQPPKEDSISDVSDETTTTQEFVVKETFAPEQDSEQKEIVAEEAFSEFNNISTLFK